MATCTRTETRSDLVGAAFRSVESALAHLVAHGIGERLDRVSAGDRVAVHVQQRVELVESQSPIAPEQREACRAQRSAAERERVVVQRRKRRLVVPWWATAVAPLDAWPQPVAQLAEPLEDRVTPLGEVS